VYIAVAGAHPISRLQAHRDVAEALIHVHAIGSDAFRHRSGDLHAADVAGHRHGIAVDNAAFGGRLGVNPERIVGIDLMQPLIVLRGELRVLRPLPVSR
jgi:hypothetical protein